MAKIFNEKAVSEKLTLVFVWRNYENRMKKKHFEAYENDELRRENRPVDVSESHFKDLLEYWNSGHHKGNSKVSKGQKGSSSAQKAAIQLINRLVTIKVE
uniref:Uncharacterized protein LOC104229329 isoform X2 n=1 Tax=Nicotiana sylvestris TaxID=4096 RepID=A0A1U7X053_NICSY|nr:PREDICTED: uncharacterized protein LOC104229329 isoform X2 [Nicotiana sylvestris]